MTAANKKSNEYADELLGIYDEIPKAVLAAIAVSFATCGGDHLDHAKNYIADEWRTLHRQGIVPQKPSKTVCGYMSDE